MSAPAVVPATTSEPAGESRIVPDPRRPGVPMLLVQCWCGRTYTVTPEQAQEYVAEHRLPCPADCGRGAE